MRSNQSEIKVLHFSRKERARNGAPALVAAWNLHVGYSDAAFVCRAGRGHLTTSISASIPAHLPSLPVRAS